MNQKINERIIEHVTALANIDLNDINNVVRFMIVLDDLSTLANMISLDIDSSPIASVLFDTSGILKGLAKQLDRQISEVLMGSEASSENRTYFTPSVRSQIFHVDENDNRTDVTSDYSDSRESGVTQTLKRLDL